MKMDKLGQLLNELERSVAVADRKNLSVSQAPVGWHIEHSLLVVETVINAVKKSESNNYKWKFNFIRTVILMTGKIPRGKVKAPRSVQPKGNWNLAKLMDGFATAKTAIEQLDSVHRNCFFSHPYFGDLNVGQTKIFLIIHTKHHLKIINDILMSK